LVLLLKLITVSHSLFGQLPYILNPERTDCQIIVRDEALLNGTLALACLDRDLDLDMKPSTLSLRLKGKAIRTVRQRLSAQAGDVTVETIGAIASLAAFDLLECLGQPEPRPDSMSFLHLAISRKGGLNRMAEAMADTYRECHILKRTILWLDASYAVLDNIPTRFSFYEAPILLASSALHTVSLYMTPLQIVFAELSELSRLADENEPAASTTSSFTFRMNPGDQVSGIERYVTNLTTQEVAADVLEILRLATFLYSARYIRRFSSNSRIQMRLAIRLQKCVNIHFSKIRTQEVADYDSHLVGESQDFGYLSIIVWSSLIGAAASGSLREICGRDDEAMRELWVDLILSMLRDLEIYSISRVEDLIAGLVTDTQRARGDRRLLLAACGVPEV
jgi:hypothetical protein